MAQNTLKIALAQLNPIVGDVAGNEARPARRARRRPRLGADLVMFPELFLAGYPPEDLVLKPAFQDACRAACEALARETARWRARRCSSACPGARAASSTTPMRCSTAARSRRALQGRPAELRRLRREARVRAGAAAGPGGLPRRAHRRADLRGHLGRATSVECLAETGAEILLVPERLALSARQDRRAPATSPSRASPRAACRSSISTRSAARTSWSSTAPPSCSTPTRRSPASCRPSRRPSR